MSELEPYVVKERDLTRFDVALICMSVVVGLRDEELDQIFKYIVNLPHILKELQEHDIVITGVKDGIPVTVYKNRVDH